MSPDETKVLIGGRRIRKVPMQSIASVECENQFSDAVRKRKPLITSTPAYNQQKYNSPTYNSPNWNSPLSNDDSGFHGSILTNEKFYSRGSRSKKDSSLWNSLSGNFKNVLSGRKSRSSFLDDDISPRWKKINPQKVLGGILCMTILSSFGFGILITVRHFDSRQGTDSRQNGKYRSIEYAREQKKELENPFANDEDIVPESNLMENIEELDALQSTLDEDVGDKITTADMDSKTETLVKPTKSFDDVRIGQVKNSNGKVSNLEMVKIGKEVKKPSVTRSNDKKQLEKSKRNVKLSKDFTRNTNPLEGKQKPSQTKIPRASQPRVNRKAKSRNNNPLTSSFDIKKRQKITKAKSSTNRRNLIENVDYPDLPTFRKSSFSE